MEEEVKEVKEEILDETVEEVVEDEIVEEETTEEEVKEVKKEEKKGPKQFKVAIVGYGNLGKGVESALQQRPEFTLVKIFSNRAGLRSPFGTEFELTKNIANYAKRIDMLFLCGGSFSDIEKIGPKTIKLFNTVDSFDTHAKLEKYISSLDKLAKRSKKVAVSAGGWDPGIMSMMRLLFNSIAPDHSPAVAFWGAGVSQGHSDAIRRIKGVKNAIQYTIPNMSIVRKCEKKFDYVPEATEKHTRECFVVLEDGVDQESIKKQIVSMPNYFLGYKTTVKFVTEEKLKKMQEKMFHKGYVTKHFKCSEKYATKISFNLDIESNPYFTAEVLVMLGVAVSKLTSEKKYGAYSVLDLPLTYLTNIDRSTLLKTIL